VFVFGNGYNIVLASKPLMTALPRDSFGTFEASTNVRFTAGFVRHTASICRTMATLNRWISVGSVDTPMSFACRWVLVGLFGGRPTVMGPALGDS
jgi:hypothetical protein